MTQAKYLRIIKKLSPALYDTIYLNNEKIISTYLYDYIPSEVYSRRVIGIGTSRVNSARILICEYIRYNKDLIEFKLL